MIRGSAPAPDNDATSALTFGVGLRKSVPMYVVAAVGLKLTTIVQDPPGPTPDGQPEVAE